MKRVHPLDALFSFPPDSRSILSFIPKAYMRYSPLSWCADLGSNQGPTGYEPVALPAELCGPFLLYVIPRGCQPYPYFGFLERASFATKFHTPQSAIRIWHYVSRKLFNFLLPGWDAVISSMPSPRSCRTLFPGDIKVLSHFFQRMVILFSNFTASSGPSPLWGEAGQDLSGLF